MSSPKTLKLFLMDGVSDGRIICELSNWTGKAYKLPRVYVKQSNDREELRSTGVYFLLGREADEKYTVYIGEAEDIYQRLMQHLSTKDFWNEAIVFISKDENLNKAHIKYLEHRLHQIACKTDRYIIKNSNIPNKPSISEPDQAEMEEFVNNIVMIIPVLGHKVLEDVVKVDKRKKDILELVGPRGADAKGIVTPEGFVVLKGSKFASSVVNSFQGGLVKLRDKLISEKILLNIENSLELSADYVFSSPSTAASLVLGRPANGLTEWKNKASKTLKDLYKK